MSGVLLNRSSCSLRTSSLIVAVRQPPFAFFFVDLIITNSLGPINLFWLFGCSHQMVRNGVIALWPGAWSTKHMWMCLQYAYTWATGPGIAVSAYVKARRDHVNWCVSSWLLRGQGATRENRGKIFIQMNQHNCWGGSDGRIIDGGRRKGGP